MNRFRGLRICLPWSQNRFYFWGNHWIVAMLRFLKDNGMKIEIEREEDGRWIAEIPEIPAALVHAGSRRQAIDRIETLALRVVADRLEHGERVPELDELFAVPA